MNDLFKPLSELNNWLQIKNIEIELVIIGAFAIHLHGLTNRMTMDIDTISAIDNDEILIQIKKIGEKYGLPNWLNDQAENLIMPEGYQQRVLENNSLKQIKLFYISKEDLIKLKVAAYFYRGDSDPKDKDDLEILSMTKKDLDIAIQFLKNTHRPDTVKFQIDFDERIKVIAKDLLNVSK